jgi:hypothetical protein
MPWHGRAEPALYFPQAQMWSPQPMFLIVREKIGVNSLAEPLRRALSEIDPELPLANVRPLETVASAAVVPAVLLSLLSRRSASPRSSSRSWEFTV